MTKTLYITCNQQPVDESQQLYQDFLAKNGHLPDAVRNEKAFQVFYQVGLLGPDNDCVGFLTTGEHGVKLAPDALVGSIQVRIDYDANFNYASEGEPPEIVSLESLEYNVSQALAEPNTLCKFPENCGIDHIRVTIRVAPDQDFTRTFWPQQLGEYLDRSTLRY